jgi:hypothetical protein
MDFVLFNRDKHGYNNILVVINRLFKKSISIFYYKIIIAEKIALLFIYYIWRYFGPLDFIISDRGP